MRPHNTLMKGMGMPRVRSFRVKRPKSRKGLSRCTAELVSAYKGEFSEVPLGVVMYCLESSTLYYTSLGGKLDGEFESLASRLFSLGLLLMPPFDDIEDWRKYDYMALIHGLGIVKPFRWDEKPKWFLYGIAHRYMGIAVRGARGLREESVITPPLLSLVLWAGGGLGWLWGVIVFRLLLLYILLWLLFL